MSERPHHMLLVEDNAAHSELIIRAFEHYGSQFTLTQVHSLAEAAMALADPDQRPDLLIVDWRLPDGNGRDLLTLVTAQYDVPVVIMTSHGNEQVAAESIKAGALDYVVKSEQTLIEMPLTARRALHTWHNLQQRRRAEAALAQSEARLRLITDHANDLIALIDQVGTVLYISPSAQSVLGYHPDSMIGRSIFDYIRREDQQITEKQLGNITRSIPAQITYRVRHDDGSWRWIDVRGSLIEQADQCTIVIVGRDVTEQRILQEQLLQVQKLEAIGQLAGGVAHDFNNLLVVIAGYADLVSMALTPDHPTQKDLHEILEATRRAGNLTRQLLTFARRQMGDFQIVNLNHLVRNIENMLRRLIRENIRLISVLEDGLWPIHADPGQIEQVIVNVIINARDAMPNGGTITISTRNVGPEERSNTMAGLQPGAYLELQISDNGSGMDAEVQQRAFEPFFTTKEPGHGTGLGLSTCYGIVKQHNGSIHLRSEPGRGTSVHIYLPRTQPTAQTSDRIAPATMQPHGSETILLVEDEETVRVITARALQLHGYRVIETDNGADGQAIASRTPIDLLITDLVLPIINGYELSTLLQRRQPSLAVLYMSGYATDSIPSGELLALQQQGRFLQKPFTISELLGKVRHILDHVATAKQSASNDVHQ